MNITLKIKKVLKILLNLHLGPFIVNFMFLIIRVNDQAFCISSQTCKVSSFSYQKVFKKLLLREFSDRSIYLFLHLAARVESFLLYTLDELSWFKMLYFEHMIWFNKKEINEAPPYIYNTTYIHTYLSHVPYPMPWWPFSNLPACSGLAIPNSPSKLCKRYNNAII